MIQFRDGRDVGDGVVRLENFCRIRILRRESRRQVARISARASVGGGAAQPLRYHGAQCGLKAVPHVSNVSVAPCGLLRDTQDRRPQYKLFWPGISKLLYSHSLSLPW